MVEVTLSKKYPAHDAEVDHLSFREPSGLDIAEIGMPIQIVGDTGKIEIIAKVVRDMMVRLSEPPCPPSTFNAMAAPDFMKCMGAVLPFFKASDGPTT